MEDKENRTEIKGRERLAIMILLTLAKWLGDHYLISTLVDDIVTEMKNHES
jgi:hypothetical protein